MISFLAILWTLISRAVKREQKSREDQRRITASRQGLDPSEEIQRGRKWRKFTIMDDLFSRDPRNPRNRRDDPRDRRDDDLDERPLRRQRPRRPAPRTEFNPPKFYTDPISKTPLTVGIGIGFLVFFLSLIVNVTGFGQGFGIPAERPYLVLVELILAVTVALVIWVWGLVTYQSRTIQNLGDQHEQLSYALTRMADLRVIADRTDRLGAIANVLPEADEIEDILETVQRFHADEAVLAQIANQWRYVPDANLPLMAETVRRLDATQHLLDGSVSALEARLTNMPTAVTIEQLNELNELVQRIKNLVNKHEFEIHRETPPPPTMGAIEI